MPDETQEQDEDVKVVLRQKLLSVDEVFVYRIPPMKTSGGHRAEDWDLAKPLATCSLTVERRDDSCLISFMTAKPKEGGPTGSTEPSLFAQSTISLTEGTPIKYWIEGVVDSSRYFAVRISDGKREAHIGMGFRERDDASNFKMSLLEYENAIRREQKAQAMHSAYEEEAAEDSSKSGSESGGMPPVSKLSLKEGEKIHVNIKGAKPRKEKERPGGKAPLLSGKVAGAPLLRKPPPPPQESAEEKEKVSISMSEVDIAREHAESKDSDEDSSECAVVDVSDVDDDEWGDFESSAASLK